jgi:hypothetical protein
MQHQSDELDDAIDNALRALREAVPPEGIEARIANRLAQTTLSQTEPAARGWWHGAACGAAAAATLAAGLGLLLVHRAPVPPQSPQAASRPAVVPHNAPVPVDLVPAAAHRPESAPCTGSVRDRAIPIAGPLPAAPLPTPEELRAEAMAPSRPAPALPLTEQERALLRLTRTADPAQLAALNEEAQAKLEAEDAAEFEKFFTPPPTPPQPSTQDNE